MKKILWNGWPLELRMKGHKSTFKRDDFFSNESKIPLRRNRIFMRNLSTVRIHICFRNILFVFARSCDESWDDACSKSIGKFHMAIWSARQIYVFLPDPHTLKHLSQPKKIKKNINRLSELPWICSLDRPCTVYSSEIAGLRKKVRACTLGYSAETCREICMHGSDLLALHAKMPAR